MVNPVIVTTQHKGVFFGYFKGKPEKTMRITNARMCVFWSADVRGLLGLAANGPTAACKIGPRAPGITLFEVTSVIEVSDEAVLRWEEAPWSK